jgi:hypothetical protein
MSAYLTVTSFTGVGTVVTGGNVEPSTNGLNINVPTGTTASHAKDAKRPTLRLVPNPN